MTEIEINADSISITLRRDGEQARFHALWLLDNTDAARDAQNGQRLLSFNELPDPDDHLTCHVSSADISDQGQVTVAIGTPAQTVRFSAEWLWAHAYDLSGPANRGWVADHIQLWQSGLAVPLGSFDAIQQEDGALRDWLQAIHVHGFAKLEKGPIRDGVLLDIVSRFGYVRETNYGTLFNVRSEVNPINLAYTGLGLQAHTDNPYRDPVPSLQLLYCLENSATGGESQVVDGFAVVQCLRDTDPKAFDLLTSYPVRFTYTGAAGVHLTSRKPIIELTTDGELRAVHFNNRSIAPLTDIGYAVMPAFYKAVKAFGALVDSPTFQVDFKLAPGESFMVDNQRVLHGRNGYDGSGTRWLQGCYPERDGLLSTLSALTDTLREAS